MKVNGKEMYLQDYEKSALQVKKIKKVKTIPICVKLFTECVEYFKSPVLQQYIEDLEDVL
jgi:hypothetical protein